MFRLVVGNNDYVMRIICNYWSAEKAPACFSEREVRSFCANWVTMKSVSHGFISKSQLVTWALLLPFRFTCRQHGHFNCYWFMLGSDSPIVLLPYCLFNWQDERWHHAYFHWSRSFVIVTTRKIQVVPLKKDQWINAWIAFKCETSNAKPIFSHFSIPNKECWKDPYWTGTIYEPMNANRTILMAEPVLWLASGMLWKKRNGVFLLQLLPSLSAPQIDSQCLEREVAAISVVEWILPLLLENKCSKNKLLWEASEQQRWKNTLSPRQSHTSLPFEIRCEFAVRGASMHHCQRCSKATQLL